MAENCELCEQPILTKILQGKTIALDVGHGWNTTSLFDAGATGNGTTEHKLNKATAYRAAEILETLGAKVYVFNYENEREQVSLRNKGKRAGGVKADLFVSIHHNAFKDWFKAQRLALTLKQCLTTKFWLRQFKLGWLSI